MWPPNPPQCLLGYWGATWIYPMSIPRWIRRHYQSWCQSDSFPWLLNCWPPKPSPQVPPCVSRVNLLGVYPFPDGSADMCQMWWQSVPPFDSFPIFLNVWPLNPPPKCPPCVSRAICLAYIHSQVDQHICDKFGVNRSSRLTASPNFWICDTLTPPNAPWDIEGRLVYSLCPFLHESADVNQNWCQSDSFPRMLNFWPPKKTQVSRGTIWLGYIHMNLHMCANLGANRPSRLVAFSRNVLRVVRLFADESADSRKNTPKTTFIHRKL